MIGQCDQLNSEVSNHSQALLSRDLSLVTGNLYHSNLPLGLRLGRQAHLTPFEHNLMSEQALRTTRFTTFLKNPYKKG